VCANERGEQTHRHTGARASVCVCVCVHLPAGNLPARRRDSSAAWEGYLCHRRGMLGNLWELMVNVRTDILIGEGWNERKHFAQPVNICRRERATPFRPFCRWRPGRRTPPGPREKAAVMLDALIRGGSDVGCID
jgi:hypothetical protein